MLACMRLPVIMLAVGISCATQAQESTKPANPSSPQNLQSAPIPNPEQAKSTQDNQNTTRQPVVQHGTGQTPNHQEGSRQPGRSGDGDRVIHKELSKPEEVTAEYTVYLVFATIALVVATIVLAVATVGLYRQTKRLAEQAVAASEDTKKSIEISERSAASADRAAQAAVSALDFERAWITSHGTTTTPATNLTNENGETFEEGLGFSAVWKNTGRSPALKVGVTSSIAIVDINEDPPTFRADHFVDRAIVFGPEFVSQSPSAWIVGADLAQFKAGRKAVMLYSEVVYATTSDTQNDHYTDTCLKFVPNGVEGLGAMQRPNILVQPIGTQNTAT